MRKKSGSLVPQEEKSLYPVLHVAGSLKEYQQELVKKEVAPLWEVSQVRGEVAQAVSEARGFAVVASQVKNRANELNQSIADFQQTLCQFFNQIKDQYREVVRHIQSASRLGATKSTMFEDMDNMISQLPLLVEDMEAKR